MFKKLGITVSIFLLSVLLFSCSNAISSFEFAQRLIDEVNYQNSPVMNVQIRSESGTGTSSPNGDFEKKVSDVISLNFEENSEYAFVKWVALDKNTEEEITDIVEFEDATQRATYATIKNYAPNIWIKPICKIRPAIISYTPIYNADGVYKSQPIIVFFDKKMSLDSIYYTQSELADLAAAGIPESNLLKSTGQDYSGSAAGRAYGYKDASGNVYWKNIEIKVIGSNQNLLEHFYEPYFTASDRSVLRIAVNAEDPLTPDKNIVVTLKNGFIYEDNEQPVGIATNFSWTYKTNNTPVNIGPVFSDDSKITIICPQKNNGNELYTNSQFEAIESKDSKLQKCIRSIHNKGTGRKAKFTFNGSLESEESKITKIEIFLNSKNNTKYYPCTPSSTPIATISNFYTTTDPKRSLTLAKEIELDMGNETGNQGVYEITVKATDSENHTSEKKWCFVWDNDITPPTYSGDPSFTDSGIAHQAQFNISLNTSGKKDQKTTLYWGSGKELVRAKKNTTNTPQTENPFNPYSVIREVTDYGDTSYSSTKYIDIYSYGATYYFICESEDIVGNIARAKIDSGDTGFYSMMKPTNGNTTITSVN